MVLSPVAVNEPDHPSNPLRGGDNKETKSLGRALPTPLIDSPPDFGLLVSLGPDPNAVRPTHCITLKFVPDSSLPRIHPNVRCPSSIPADTTRLLHGGGSGAAVFAGHDSELGSVVMKHGNHKDLDEVVALATVARELALRGRLGPEAKESAIDLAGRIPDFRFVYLSPDHLRDRGSDLWIMLRRALARWGSKGLRDRASSVSENGESSAAGQTAERSDSWAYSDSGASVSTCSSNPDLSASERPSRSDRTSLLDKKYANPDRIIRIFMGKPEKGESMVIVTPHHLDVYLEPDKDIVCRKGSSSKNESPQVQLSGPPNASGYAALKRFSVDLHAVLRHKMWKATMAQSTIGSPEAPTASSLHLSGKLREDNGRLLDVLIDEFVRVVRGLRSLTHPEEKGDVDRVKEEVAELESRLVKGQDISGADVSERADTFVGKAILKNFHPTLGRGQKLRAMSERFRSGSLILTSKENIPADALGKVLDPSITFGEVFIVPTDIICHPTGKAAMLSTFWDGIYGGVNDGLAWLKLLRHATSLQGEPCTARVWNGGLADAGLHNQFLDGGKLFLFDLGKPTCEPIPAFLTKFFMSFFHTPGMEEKEGGGWVCRFRVVEEDGSQKLALTAESEQLLSQVYTSFQRTLDRLISELFDGEEKVRSLIIKYVLLQLVSDAAFCLERWEMKGGGNDRTDNHHSWLEKWLWRALWDLYAAWHVGCTLLTADSWN